MILVVKDPHFRFGFPNPSGRVDDYGETMSRKIDGILDIAKSYDCRYLVMTGDIIDKKYKASYSVDKLYGNIMGFKRLCSFFDDAFTIAGNHDMPYNSYENYEDSVFKMIIDTIPNLHDVSNMVVDVSDGLQIGGIPYMEDKKELLRSLSSMSGRFNADISVMILHEHFVPKGAKGDDLRFTEFFFYDDIIELDGISHFVFGHLHRGFDPIYFDRDGRKIWFINPYSIFRLSRNYYSLSGSHIPQVSVIKEDGEAINVNLPDKYYEPFDKVFKIGDDGKVVVEDQDVEFVDFDVPSYDEVSDDIDLTSISNDVREIINKYIEIANKDN